MSQLKMVTEFFKTITDIRGKKTSILLMREDVKEENRIEVRAQTKVDSELLYLLFLSQDVGYLDQKHGKSPSILLFLLPSLD